MQTFRIQDFLFGFLLKVDPFGGIDYGPEDVLEAVAPVLLEFVGGRITGAGVERLLLADDVGLGIEVVRPCDVFFRAARFPGFRGSRVLDDAGVVSVEDEGEVGFFLRFRGLAGEQF